jgi:hypothetical protein
LASDAHAKAGTLTGLELSWLLGADLHPQRPRDDHVPAPVLVDAVSSHELFVDEARGAEALGQQVAPAAVLVGSPVPRVHRHPDGAHHGHGRELNRGKENPAAVGKGRVVGDLAVRDRVAPLHAEGDPLSVVDRGHLHDLHGADLLFRPGGLDRAGGLHVERGSLELYGLGLRGLPERSIGLEDRLEVQAGDVASLHGRFSSIAPVGSSAGRGGEIRHAR